MTAVAASLEDDVFERLQSVAMDATLQVSAGMTIGARALAPAFDATMVAGSATASASDAKSEVHSLPRISLGAIGEAMAPALDGRRQPDLCFEKVLGEGGMGRVHLANQHSLRRRVAVKTLKEGATRDAHQALLSEARVTGFLAHPGIIPVHSLGLDDRDQPVLVMKCIEGLPWRDLLDDPDNSAWQHWEARIGDRLQVHLEILTKVCDAVHFAHSQGVVHRDIKPDNVMLGRFGEVYLVDWGLALEIAGEQSSQLVGTPAYMAPEMALGQPVDVRTDVYLLGATLHELLTGEHLHRGKTLRDLLLHAIDSAPYDFPTRVPTELAALCRAATSKDVDRRPASADRFRQAIANFLAHRSSVAVSDAALLRLQESEGDHADSSVGAQERAYYLGTHCAEARFGFEQALEAWPQNEAAHRGLQRCRELLVQAHLLRRDPVGALAELQAMQQQPTGLLEQITRLQEELSRERSDQERLKKLDIDSDESMAFRERLWAYLIMLAGTASVCWQFVISGTHETIENSDTVTISAVFLTASLAVLLLTRKKLLANVFNRRVVFLVFVALISMLLNRTLGWRLNTPVQNVFVADLILMAACTALGGATLTAWLIWMTPVYVTGAVVLALAPVHSAPLVFSASALGSLSVGGCAWLLQDRRKSRG